MTVSRTYRILKETDEQIRELQYLLRRRYGIKASQASVIDVAISEYLKVQQDLEERMNGSKK